MPYFPPAPTSAQLLAQLLTVDVDGSGLNATAVQSVTPGATGLTALAAANAAALRTAAALGTISTEAEVGYALLAGRSGGQTLIGGTGATDDLVARTTSGVGATGADMVFQVGNNGATEAMRILNNGRVGVGAAAPGSQLHALSAAIGVIGLIVGMPTGATAVAQEWQLNGVTRANLGITAGATFLGLTNFDNGAGMGPFVVIERNTNATTPAAGCIRFTTQTGAEYYLWVDSVGKLRVGTSQPTNANDATGAIVGTQT